MAYIVHPESTVVDSETIAAMGSDIESFESRQLAHEALTAKPTTETGEKRIVSFFASYRERDAWKNREYNRLYSTREYIPVPWSTDAWSTSHCYEMYCHMSLKHPGLVAYTPNDEFGMQDRQLRVKPGKFLEQFASDYLSRETIADYVARVKGFDGKYQIATDADEIEAVYVHGPQSCMSHTGLSECGHDSCRDREHCTQRWTTHPVRVYADPSDLAVAYFGTPDKVTARCVVWPDKRIYTRIYGDDALRHALQADGYVSGTVDGAKVRKLTTKRGSGYVMPYIDAADGADLDGSMFVLCDSESEYGTKNVDGTAHEVETNESEPEDELPTCEHCEQRQCDDMNDQYCSRCERDRHYCETCGTDSWDDGETVDGEFMCDDCASDASVTCENCSEIFWQENFSDTDQHDRTVRHVTALCAGCADGIQVCQSCSETFPADDTVCEHCHEEVHVRVRCEHTADLLSIATVDGIPESTAVLRDSSVASSQSLRDAFRTASWHRAHTSLGQCQISGCRRTIAAGELYLRAEAGFGYCRACVDGYHAYAPAPAVPADRVDIPALSQILPNLAPETEAAF